MKNRYADVHNVDKALDRIIQSIDHTDDETVSLNVCDNDFAMRGITFEEARERNLTDAFEHLCSFNYDGTRLTLHFHEKHVKGTFSLNPAGPDAISSQQADNPGDLAPDLKPVVQRVEERFNVISWDFVEVSAASMASGGHFTDFEFEYVVTGV